MNGFEQVELVSQGPTSIVRVHNLRHLSRAGVLELGQELLTIASRPDCKNFVVDFSQVSLINSEVLSRLIMLQRNLKQKGGKLILCGIRPEIQRIFGWTKLDSIFECRPDGMADYMAEYQSN